MLGRQSLELIMGIFENPENKWGGAVIENVLEVRAWAREEIAALNLMTDRPPADPATPAPVNGA